MAPIKISSVIHISYPKFELNKIYALSIRQETVELEKDTLTLCIQSYGEKETLKKIEGQKHIFRVEMGYTDQGRLNRHKLMLLSFP